MSDFRKRPKDNFIQETDWQELYVLTNHWKSDLLFYKDDLRFLHHLIDKYFIWITKKDNLAEVQKVGRHILEDENICDQLLEKITKNSSHLADLIDDPYKYDSNVFREKHQDLEDKIAVFIKTVRKNRKQLFAVTEHILDSEQLTHLMEK